MLVPVLSSINCVAWCCNFCACQDCLCVTHCVNGFMHCWPRVSHSGIGLVPYALVFGVPRKSGVWWPVYGGSGVPYSWLGLVNPGVWCAQLSCFSASLPMVSGRIYISNKRAVAGYIQTESTVCLCILYESGNKTFYHSMIKCFIPRSSLIC